MFQQIRCRPPLFIHCAQATPVRPHCTNFFGYDYFGHDTGVMILKHICSRDSKRTETRIEPVFVP